MRGIAWRTLQRFRLLLLAASRHIEVDDLVQEGLLAAMTALDRWDPAGGASPATWAALRAKGAMIDHCRQRRPVQVVPIDAAGPLRERRNGPAEVWAQAQVGAITARLTGRRKKVVLELARGATHAEAGAAAGISAGRVRQYLAQLKRAA